MCNWSDGAAGGDTNLASGAVGMAAVMEEEREADQAARQGQQVLLLPKKRFVRKLSCDRQACSAQAGMIIHSVQSAKDCAFVGGLSCAGLIVCLLSCFVYASLMFSIPQ